MNVCGVKTCDWITVFMFHSGNGVTVGFLRFFFLSYLVAFVTTDRSTGAEDMHSDSIFIRVDIAKCEKKFVKFSFLQNL